jgi:glycosyltransferase involved in cell wall biosynthesis
MPPNKGVHPTLDPVTLVLVASLRLESCHGRAWVILDVRNMISFIVPAHNEELLIGGCLASIRTTMDKIGAPCEMSVVDDASTDSTLQIAQEAGVRTLRVEHRKISAVRNEGARAACGEVLFFVDADTQVNEQAVGAALAAMRSGATGGGCVPDLEGSVPLWGRIIHFVACGMGRLILPFVVHAMTARGCVTFCTDDVLKHAGNQSRRLNQALHRMPARRRQ